MRHRTSCLLPLTYYLTVVSHRRLRGCLVIGGMIEKTDVYKSTVAGCNAKARIKKFNARIKKILDKWEIRDIIGLDNEAELRVLTPCK